MKLRLLLFLPLLAAGCASQPSAHPIARELRQQGMEPVSFQVKNDDAEMRQAVLKARRTVARFIAALEHPGPGQKTFEVKKPFVQGEVLEHMWLSGVTWSGGHFHGTVDNRPRSIKGVKFGDKVSVNPGEITDWAYIDNGKLVGGYTIRVLCAGLSPEQRAACEKELCCKIGKP